MNHLTSALPDEGLATPEYIQSLGRAALIVAHPSHELRVYGWLELAEPRVFIWTDGSGRSGIPRLEWTTSLLANTAASPGSIYGRLTDTDVYAAVLRRDFSLFIDLADELAEALVQEEIEYVVADAVEGHNVTHEVGRLMTGAAVEMASKRRGTTIRNFDFLVVGPPDECPDDAMPTAIQVCLDESAFKRKLDAALSHHPKLADDINAALGGTALSGIMRFTEPGIAAAATGVAGDMARLSEFPELAAQIKGLFERTDLDSFRNECLRPVSNRAGSNGSILTPPFYEAYGEKLVGAGLYQQVIRHHEHIRPLADALWDHVERQLS